MVLSAVQQQLHEAEDLIDILRLKCYKYERYLASNSSTRASDSLQADGREGRPAVRPPILYADARAGNLGRHLRFAILGGEDPLAWSQMELSPLREATETAKSTAAHNEQNTNVSGVVGVMTTAPLCQCRGLFPFDGDLAKDELPFQPGDVLDVLEKDVSGWWLARDAFGREGMLESQECVESVVCL
jgi:hypothetical protein